MSRDKSPEDDEFALFRQEMRDAEPLRQDPRVTPSRELPKAVVRKRKIESEAEPLSAFSDMFADNVVGNEEVLEFRRPGIQHKQFAKLRSGKVHIDAELDLHGMTAEKAEPILSVFLEQCQQQQIRCVRVIHGKGWGSRDNRPVLKSKVNHWLRQSDAVLAFCSATIEDGGSGALYVLLKRQFTD
ncbi:Smr/MutS family protein [Methylophaga sp. OBS3]|uniref:Smr/MutS family protein n=1 Tax=Methylophaga sp. OBS3 TaxID=2991934 RepID=UPI00225B91FB|nr:Smr/MutS family protein [Methylophaga sp. OBS3]MCX4189347.1 Smr/MutS family protein [Methylophaga sp. OBS3]